MRLADRAKAPVLALSGGMAQRLMVARAIMHKPQILFLDEPTAGLDPQSRIALWEIMQELHAIGQTIMLTTHYMEEADQLCDRVAIMDHGRILALDTPAALKQQPRRRQHRAHPAPTGDLDRLANAPAGRGRRRHRAPRSSTASIAALGIGPRPAAPHHRRRRGRSAPR